MSERAAGIDDDAMKFGLLMESAQAHQKLAEVHLEKLRAHAQDLDCIVREEIRRTLIEEMRGLAAESDRASQALRGLKRAAAMRGAFWNIGIAGLCTAIPLAIAHIALPSESSVAALRTRRDLLAQDVARLEQLGGKVEWRTCGTPARLCVRIDRKAPFYGETSDYVVVKGY